MPRRSIWKGSFVDAFLLRMKKKRDLLLKRKIWSRRSSISQDFVDCSVRIYNGKTPVRCKRFISIYCAKLYFLYLRNTWFQKVVLLLWYSIFLLLFLCSAVLFFHSVLHLRDTMLAFIGKGEIAPYLYMNLGSPAPAPLPADPGIPLIPELPNPLIADDVRMRELEDRISFHFILIGVDLNDEVRSGILASQTVIEKRVEAALVMDGFNPEAILAKRGQIRGFLFYPKGKVLARRTYLEHFRSIEIYGTRECLPYKRVLRALNNSELIL